METSSVETTDPEVLALNESLNDRERQHDLRIMAVKTGAELIPLINTRPSSRGDERSATWDRVYHYLFPDPRESADSDDEDARGKVFTDILSSRHYSKLTDEEKTKVERSLILIENKLITGTDCDYLLPFLNLKKRVLGTKRAKLLGIGTKKGGVSREIAQKAFDNNLCAPSSDPIVMAQISWQNIALSYKNFASQIFARGLTYMRQHTNMLQKTDPRAANLLLKNMTLNRANRNEIEYFWELAAQLSFAHKDLFIKELMFDKTRTPHIVAPQSQQAAAAPAAAPAAPQQAGIVAISSSAAPAVTAAITSMKAPTKKQKRDAVEQAAPTASTSVVVSAADVSAGDMYDTGADEEDFLSLGSSGASASASKKRKSVAVTKVMAAISVAQAEANSSKAAMLLAALTAHNSGANKLSADQYKAVNEKYLSLLLES